MINAMGSGGGRQHKLRKVHSRGWLQVESVTEVYNCNSGKEELSDKTFSKTTVLKRRRRSVEQKLVRA
jgi:hypothetical protein